MIRTFVEEIVFTSANTIERDVRSFEKQVNDFIKQPSVTPIRTDFRTFDNAGKKYFSALLEYNLTKI